MTYSDRTLDVMSARTRRPGRPRCSGHGEIFTTGAALRWNPIGGSFPIKAKLISHSLGLNINVISLWLGRRTIKFTWYPRRTQMWNQLISEPTQVPESDNFKVVLSRTERTVLLSLQPGVKWPPDRTLSPLVGKGFFILLENVRQLQVLDVNLKNQMKFKNELNLIKLIRNGHVPN